MTEKYLHVYGQNDHPDYVAIRGTKEALMALAELIRKVLDSDIVDPLEGDPTIAESGFLTGDGISFEVGVEAASEGAIKEWRVPYR